MEVVLVWWMLARLLNIAVVASMLVVIGEHMPLPLPLKGAVVNDLIQSAWLLAFLSQSSLEMLKAYGWRLSKSVLPLPPKVLGGMKSIKMTGLTDIISKKKFAGYDPGKSKPLFHIGFILSWSKHAVS